MSEWAQQENGWSHNLIALGDFNIDRQGDPLWQAFTSTALASPEALNKVPRTVFATPGKPDTAKFYEQIAWFQTRTGVPKLTMPYRSAGYVDFLPYVYTDQPFSKHSISYRVAVRPLPALGRVLTGVNMFAAHAMMLSMIAAWRRS